jgi:hypothetical protein
LYLTWPDSDLSAQIITYLLVCVLKM